MCIQASIVNNHILSTSLLFYFLHLLESYSTFINIAHILSSSSRSDDSGDEGQWHGG